MKVNYDTKQVMWRWGAGVGNEFDFVNDLAGADSAFYHTHSIRAQGGNRYTMFDNGNSRTDKHTFAREYELDLGATPPTATLVWSYEQPDTGSVTDNQGSVFRLDNGNTLIGWGDRRSTLTNFTEVDASNNITFQLSFEENTLGKNNGTYGVYKVPMVGVAARPYLCADAGADSIKLYLNYFGHEPEVASYNLYAGTSPEPTTLEANLTTGSYLISDLAGGQAYYFRITAVDGEGSESDYSNELSLTPVSGVWERDLTTLPGDFQLGAAFPNPFNPTATVPLALRETGRLTVVVYDVTGRRVATLHSGLLNAGTHRFTFDGSGLSSGVYFLKASMERGTSQTRRLVLIR